MGKACKKNNLGGCGGQGFTIVEMLLVVALIALLATAAGGIYIGTYNGMVAKKSARDFLLAAQYARILAIEKQSPCTLMLDFEGNGFYLIIEVVSTETAETEQMMVRDLYFKPVTLPDSVSFQNVQIESSSYEEAQSQDAEAQNHIIFRPDGSADSAIIQLGTEGNIYTAIISAATGKTKVYAGMPENAAPDTIDLDLQ
jgi:prepilin-type N-terminal cleavage/methylation domain-containing protein